MKPTVLLTYCGRSSCATQQQQFDDHRLRCALNLIAMNAVLHKQTTEAMQEGKCSIEEAAENYPWHRTSCMRQESSDLVSWVRDICLRNMDYCKLMQLTGSIKAVGGIAIRMSVFTPY